MSDIATGARAPDDSTSRAGQVAQQATSAAGDAASNVKDTAAEQARRVTSEAGRQARTVAAEVKDKVGQQARTQHSKLVDNIRKMADELDGMREQRGESPAASVVSRVADGGRQMADYLDRNGPEGVLREVQAFARRRPGAFLATALAAGFVVGRLGKGVMKADESTDDKPLADAYTYGSTDTAAALDTPSTGYSTAGTGTAYGADPTYGTDPAYGTTSTYGTGTTTEYASTGTGTPVPLEQPYADPVPPPYVDPGYESRPPR